MPCRVMFRPTFRWERLLDLFFPDRCAVCARSGALLCARCAGSFQPHPAFAAPAGIDEVAVAFLYDGALPRLLYRLKYDKRRRLAEPLGDLLADWYLARQPPPNQALLAVPLHAARRAERGFNQAAELARRIHRRSSQPLIDGLIRTRDTGHQAALSRSARAVNLQEAFHWHHHTPPPADLVLIDDVYTTGATMGACAAALRAAGAQRISAIALARSDLSRSRDRHRTVRNAARSRQ